MNPGLQWVCPESSKGEEKGIVKHPSGDRRDDRCAVLSARGREACRGSGGLCAHRILPLLLRLHPCGSICRTGPSCRSEPSPLHAEITRENPDSLQSFFPAGCSSSSSLWAGNQDAWLPRYGRGGVEWGGRVARSEGDPWVPGSMQGTAQ